MTVLREITWQEAMGPDFGNLQRVAWREAVASIAAKAREKLPEHVKAIEKAETLVLHNEVTDNKDGSWTVGSLTSATKTYRVTAKTCECPDFAKAGNDLCKHRVAVMMLRRANDLIKGGDGLSPPNGHYPPLSANESTVSATNNHPEIPDSSPRADLFTGNPLELLPEAPVSINIRGYFQGRETQVTVRGIDFASVRGEAEAASQWLDEPTPAQVQAANDNGKCEEHQVPWRRQEKNNQVWFSHKLPDGKWHRKPEQPAPT